MKNMVMGVAVMVMSLGACGGESDGDIECPVLESPEIACVDGEARLGIHGTDLTRDELAMCMRALAVSAGVETWHLPLAAGDDFVTAACAADGRPEVSAVRFVSF